MTTIGVTARSTHLRNRASAPSRRYTGAAGSAEEAANEARWAFHDERGADSDGTEADASNVNVQEVGDGDDFVCTEDCSGHQALSLPWAHVDLTQGVIHVRHAQHLGLRMNTGKSRDIPMTGKYKEILLELWGRDKRLPFKAIRHWRANEHWQDAREALGNTDIDCVPYATRHSLAARIIEATGDLNQAKEWLGHSSITLTADTYGHVNTKYLIRGADALNERRALADESRVTRDSVVLGSTESATSTAKKLN